MNFLSKALILGLCLVALGCPKERRAREAAAKAVELSAEVLVAVRSEFATHYTAAADAALNACDTRACYDAAMAKWDKAADALDTARASLKILDSALAAWASGSPNGQQDFRHAAGCFLKSLVDLREALETQGVKLHNLSTAIGIGSSILGLDPAGDLCPALEAA